MKFIEAKDVIALYMAGANKWVVKKQDVDNFCCYLQQRFKEQNKIYPVILYSDFYLKKLKDEKSKLFHITDDKISCTATEKKERNVQIKQLLGQMSKPFASLAIAYTKDYISQHSENLAEDEAEDCDMDELEKLSKLDITVKNFDRDK